MSDEMNDQVQEEQIELTPIDFRKIAIELIEDGRSEEAAAYANLYAGDAMMLFLNVMERQRQAAMQAALGRMDRSSGGIEIPLDIRGPGQ